MPVPSAAYLQEGAERRRARRQLFTTFGVVCIEVVTPVLLRLLLAFALLHQQTC